MAGFADFRFNGRPMIYESVPWSEVPWWLRWSTWLPGWGGWYHAWRARHYVQVRWIAADGRSGGWRWERRGDS